MIDNPTAVHCFKATTSRAGYPAKQPEGIPIKGQPGDCADVIPDLFGTPKEPKMLDGVGWLMVDG